MTATETAPLDQADTLTSVNPATGETLATYRIDDEAAVHAAVAKARTAAATWGALTYAERKRHILRWGSKLVEKSDELSELIHAENGKPLDDAFLELMLALEHIKWAASNAEKVLKPKKVAPGMFMSNFAAHLEYRPLGVVGIIGPWNYPVYTPNGSIAYALAAGNCVVFKPSEYSTGIGNFVAKAFAEANPELPDGVFVAINGYGATGAALVKSGVDKLAFTGSTATGKKIMAAAADTLTPVLLECGGKDAVIVAADADIKAAADAVAWGATANSGQTCAGVERVYVDKSIADEFVAEVKRILTDIKPGSDAKAAYGPMTMPSQIDIVRRHIEDAIKNGGKAVLGGPESVKGPFIEPVVLVDVDESSDAVCEETFGPTVTIRTVNGVDEAVELTNKSKYGLGSAVYSKKQGMEIARRLEVGCTSVNSVLSYAAISGLPFGGVRDSGIGRIHGAPGLLEFSRPHSIAVQRFTIPGMALLSYTRTDRTMKLLRKIVPFVHGRAK
ncbi:aldehyde dehydrogenase family protein [Nocardia seriolae]|uniref:Aldehyde dehydrogenase n=1 Tax=Nocardia seriolae TaxID=37332 RepID=A0ABC8APR9_9NOCA|nr:aldehyde dehydrogenase family protein [Nocardia seriolae]APA96181.1 Succinylglutamate-semialdehyde dehydrogenase [Nocardia seriolae]MTJ65743.1 aldehyde dehydrogenase family protein [Nocardia seriolae]MTJ71607.1 aldehyde dehydrogenase family protein [Nocardia seriolae]MTJ86324.1 aldehyde dehydrogenase family protein [Nocardia seriolae]MTK30318.1 aldehyde dehydrogenase family protein [Nocardia seriolae]